MITLDFDPRIFFFRYLFFKLFFISKSLRKSFSKGLKKSTSHVQFDTKNCFNFQNFWFSTFKLSAFFF
jgi:hypothetical protein